MGSVKTVIEELLDTKLPLYVVTGQMDTTLPHLGVKNMISKLEWSGKAEYEGGKRHVWKVGHHAAGFKRSGGGLTSVLVRNAGHMLVGDQKEWILSLLRKITAHGPSHGHSEV
jgi:carboxypeptidase C (cathepsin A)